MYIRIPRIISKPKNWKPVLSSVVKIQDLSVKVVKVTETATTEQTFSGKIIVTSTVEMWLKVNEQK